jgi:glycerophosphoryl diester phosphodiesterase
VALEVMNLRIPLLLFSKAIDLQVDLIELDVHLSADGELMVIHDETVDRTTNGKGAVNQFSVLELKQFKMEKEQRIPTLSEVLKPH